MRDVVRADGVLTGVVDLLHESRGGRIESLYQLFMGCSTVVANGRKELPRGKSRRIAAWGIMLRRICRLDQQA